MKIDRDKPTQKEFDELFDATIQYLRQGYKGWGTEYLEELLSRIQARLDERSEKAVEDIKPILFKTMQAMERRDYLAVADFLEYRLIDRFNT
jgi:hypothetical protein